jgi:uncharacterized phage protein (TIGR02218 family)
MTYATLDTSTDAGAPYELFEFTEAVRAWRYTTGPGAVTWGGQQWLPRPIVREAINRDSGSIGDPLRITLPDNDPLALELLAGMTMHQVAVRVRQVHRGDPDAEARIMFSGLVSGVSFQGASAVISCASRYAMVSKRRIAPTTYQAGCNLTWGSSRCGVNAELYRVDSTATASDQVGRVLTVAALSGYAVGHFNGGQVVFGGTRRFVEKHAAGGALTLSYPLGGLTSAPAAVAVYPDCKKTESDCISRYNNLPNYLGWTHLPSINPYNRSAYYLEEAEVVAPPAGSTGDLPGYPGYQITLAPARVEVLSIMMYEPTRMTLEFTSNGSLLLRTEVYRYNAGGGGDDPSLPGGWFLANDTTVPVPGMWASPRPTPGYGDTAFRVDTIPPLVDGDPNASILTGFAQWVDPSPSVIAVVDATTPHRLGAQWVFTIRVRNRTTGIMIAQGELTVTFSGPINQEG